MSTQTVPVTIEILNLGAYHIVEMVKGAKRHAIKSFKNDAGGVLSARTLAQGMAEIFGCEWHVYDCTGTEPRRTGTPQP